MTKTPLKVYIACPITLDPDGTNFDNSCEAQRQLLAAGFAPLNPGLTMMLPGGQDIPHSTWMASCLPWVASADLLIRVHGESVGADDEVNLALNLGIPVYCSFDDEPIAKLIEHLKECPDLIKFCAECRAARPDASELPKIPTELPKLSPAPEKPASPSHTVETVAKASQAFNALFDEPQTTAAHRQAITEERGKVYGPPKQNHEGIAMMWASLLQPHAGRIGAQTPLPGHVVALMMCALKLNRMRICYHKDNYDDLHNYADIAEAMQAEHDGEA